MVRKKKSISIVKDPNGNNIVMINAALFKGKSKVDWDEVERYVRKYVYEFYKVVESKDIIYIGKDFPDEYAHSQYTIRLVGANAKAKANAASGVPEMIKSANKVKHVPNKKKIHKKDAKYGWYYYDTRFAVPIYTIEGEVDRYKVFHAELLVRHAYDGKKYLYDIINVKKDKDSNIFV